MLSSQQVDEMFKNVELSFISYYKYVFYYYAVCNVDGNTYQIKTAYGGNSDMIYRYDVSPAKSVYFDSHAIWNKITVDRSVNDNWVNVYSFYDF